ncbi:Cna B-type domain-containing protein [Eggerthella timonensis]|uniref:Cna B-type domain-containing protein n=1 Tax=Eggerthella timonensis TaxID=1871008 RepID=UPI0015E0C8F6|nr:Cna B-type domain-containing protein [Eggerthella timonensis]
MNTTTRPYPAARARRLFVALAVALSALALVLPAPLTAHAEGSKELVAHGGYRPYTERYNASTAGESRLTELYAYVKEGETVSFGTSIKDAVARFTNEKMGTSLSDAELAALNQCDIVVCDPAWVQQQQADPGTGNAHAYPYFQGARDARVTTYDVSADATADNGAPGYIGSVAREAGGASGPDGNGYAPLTFTAQKSGVYLFKFYSQALSNRNPQPYPVTDDRAFTSAAQAGGSVAAWDITVSNGDGVQNGRVFTKKLFLNMGNNFDRASILKSHMFAVTDDNYHYEIDFNGMDPFGFVFFANNRGLLDGSLDDRASTHSLYHSVRSQNNALSDLAEHGVILNNAPTNELDRTYKLFFNNPADPEVLAALDIATPDGENAISNFTFDGNPTPTPAAPELKANEGFVGEGGTFSFDVGDVAATSYEITLNFGNGNTVTLSNSLVKNGTNTIAWDGLDANGVKVPAGTYDLNNVAVKLKGGEAHFPLLDVENNYDGVKIHRLEADGMPVDSTVYYNNSSSNAGDVTPPWSMANWAVADTQDHSVTGVDTSSQGAMAYQNRAGDQTALDIWAYHDTPIALRSFQFKLMDVPTRLAVHKTWDHGANHADPLPSSVDVELLADGAVIDTQTLTAPAPGSTDGGFYAWTDLDPNKAYTVREVNVPEGYQPSEAIIGDNDEGWSIELTNAFTGNVTSIAVEKQWNGTQPPAELPISIVGRDATDAEQYRKDLVLNDGNGWKASVDGLTADQQALWFSVEEKLPDGYRQIGNANKLTPNGDGTSALSFTITNQKVVDLTVTKAWDDDGNSKGIRPTTVEMQLLKDGRPFGDPVTLSEESAWSYTWKDLVDDGSYAAFKVYESSDLGEYASSADSPENAAGFADGAATVTNALPPTTSFTAMKRWAGAPLGSTPEDIDVQLYQNNAPYGDPVPLSGTGGWQHTWFGLPTTDAGGNPAFYHALETDVPPDYEANIGNTGNTAIITNTYTGGVASIVVQKEWTGAQTPASIDVRVTGTNAAGQQQYDSGAVTLTAEGGWRAELPIAVGMRTLTFDVSEVVPEGYRQVDSTSSLSEDGKTLTFTLTNEKLMDLKATKAWVDGGDASGQRPASVQMQLLKDGAPFGDPVTVSPDTNWSHAWNGLPDDGSVYTVYETTDLPGYTSDASSAGSAVGFENGEAVITNALIPTTSFTVAKEWVNDSDTPLPGSVDVQLYQNGEPYGSAVTLTEAGGWRHTWPDLPSQGMTYTVDEATTVPLYTSTTMTDENGATITNTYTGGVAHVLVKKDWLGGQAPASLDVRVTGMNADGEQKYDSGTVTLSPDNGWSADLPIDVGMRNLSFELSEVLPDGYRQIGTSTALSDDGTVLTFSLQNQKVTSLTATKAWEDNDNSRGSRPSSVSFQLLKDGAPYGPHVIVDASGAWSHTWTDLPDDGSAYTVYEPDALPKYDSDAPSIDGAIGFPGGSATITNRIVVPTTSFSVEKTWVNDSDTPLPGSVDVQLYQNGRAWGDPVTLTEADGWRHTWTDLPDDDTTYTAEEVAVPPGYASSVATEDDVSTITNTYTGGVAHIVVKKAWTGTATLLPESLDVRVTGTDKDGQQRYDSGTVTLTAEGGWQTDLPIDVGMRNLAFAADETVPEGFELVSTESTLSEDGTTLTIALTNEADEPPTPPTPGPPTTPGTPQTPGTPGTPGTPASVGSPTVATGDVLGGALTALVALAAAAAGTLAVTVLRRKARRE